MTEHRIFTWWDHVETRVMSDANLFEMHKKRGIEHVTELAKKDGYTLIGTEVETAELGYMPNWIEDKGQWVHMNTLDFMNLTPTRRVVKMIFTGHGEKEI